MARQTPKAYYLKPRSDLLLLYFGFFFIPVTIVLSLFEPAYVPILVEINVAIIMFGAIVAGVWAWLRQRTEKLATGSEMMELAWDKPVTLEVQQYVMDQTEAEDLARELPLATEDEVKELAAMEPGTSKGDGGKSWPVDVVAYLPGGIKASFYISPHAGGQGVVIVEGQHELINFDWGKLLPYQTHIVDHSQVPTEVKAKIASLKNPNLKPGEYPIRRTGDLHPGMVEWLQKNPLAHAVVLQHLKIDGVATAIYRQIVDKFGETNSPLMTALTNGKARDFREAFTAAVGKWLEKQEPLQVSLGRGFAGVDYLRQRVYAQQATINRIEAENELYSDKSYDEVRQKRAEAARGAHIYPTPSPVDPAGDRVNRRNMRPADGTEPY